MDLKDSPMDDTTRGLSRLVDFAPLFTRWVCGAMDNYHADIPVKRRVRMTPWARENYIYDETVATAEVAGTPVPISIPKNRRMRWVSIDDGDLVIAVWFKKVDSQSLLTSIY